jgi:hypothetical protein
LILFAMSPTRMERMPMAKQTINMIVTISMFP